MILEISSAQNARYKTWLSLLTARGIKKQAQALVFGRRFIEEMLALPAGRDRVAGLITQKAGEAESLPLPEDCPVYLVPRELFASLDIYGIHEPILLLAATPMPAWEGELASGLTVFAPFQNPINLGTAIRSAAALSASVVLLKEAATPYLPKSLRASGPAILQASLFQGPGMAELAAYRRLPLYALSPRGESLFSFKFPERLGLVAGLEGPGLDEHWPLERRLSIPMAPGVESLNAAVAVSIAMALYLASF